MLAENFFHEDLQFSYLINKIYKEYAVVFCSGYESSTRLKNIISSIKRTFDNWQLKSIMGWCNVYYMQIIPRDTLPKLR